VVKLDADKYTDADFICYLDSDTIFTRPVTPELFFRDGKIAWMITPYEKVQTPWQPIVEKFLKRPVPFETMRRHPMVIPRWLLAELRAFCEREHGPPISTLVPTAPRLLNLSPSALSLPFMAMTFGCFTWRRHRALADLTALIGQEGA
jgi:hypothetical protein